MITNRNRILLNDAEKRFVVAQKKKKNKEYQMHANDKINMNDSQNN